MALGFRLWGLACLPQQGVGGVVAEVALYQHHGLSSRGLWRRATLKMQVVRTDICQCGYWVLGSGLTTAFLARKPSSWFELQELGLRAVTLGNSIQNGHPEASGFGPRTWVAL